MLKYTASSIYPSLTRLFNISLEQKIYPSVWKNANVTPLYNKNPAVLNIIESYFLHQTEVDIEAMGHACKTVIKTNIYFAPITTLD